MRWPSCLPALRAPCLVLLATLSLTTQAAAQSLSGRWHVLIEELSNTCGEPQGPRQLRDLEILQAGALVDIDVQGAPELTEVSGRVSGAELSVGFESFDAGGIEIYDPAVNALSIDAAGDRISGEAHWEFYGPADCVGTQTWTGLKTDAPSEDDLSGEWVVTVEEDTDSCGPIDTEPVIVPVSIVQEGGLIEASSAADFGQTRVIGRVAGQTLRLGLGIREAEGDFTVYDAAESDLEVGLDFASFAGSMTWRSYESLVCTGTHAWTLALPEPGPGLGFLLGAAALLGLRGARSRL